MAEPTGVFVDADYPDTDGTQPCIAEPEVFFLSTSRAMAYGLARAKEICEGCPFRRECLAYAIAWDVDGVWGGTSGKERDRIRAEHGIRARLVTTADLTTLAQQIALVDRGGLAHSKSPQPSASPPAPSFATEASTDRTRHDR